MTPVSQATSRFCGGFIVTFQRDKQLQRLQFTDVFIINIKSPFYDEGNQEQHLKSATLTALQIIRTETF